MWSFLGMALAILVQTLQTSPQNETFLANTDKLNVPQAIISPTPFKQRIANRFAETQPTPFQNKAQEQGAYQSQPSPTQGPVNESAINNRSNQVIESVATQAIAHSPALDPCIYSNCEEPTPIPSSFVHPTKIPRPTEKIVPTPFSDPVISIVPLPSQEPMPPRCPSIPPHLTKQGLERPEVADPIYCLD